MGEMTKQWIVRVQGKEYGPADIETLREWKTEGRLLAGNEARRADVDLWSTAADIPGLFDAGTLDVARGDGLTQPPLQRRSFAQILAETFRIYRNGFSQFLSLTLLVVLPSACGQLATAWFQTGSNVNLDLQTLTVGAFAFCMTVLTMVLWPVYIAAIQILTAERLAGRRIGFVAALNEAVKFWPRVAALCIFVYGVYALLTIFALAIGVMIVAGASSFLLILLTLVLLVIQIWMFGRFFINVLFWQQFAVLENAGVIDSLRESRNLARSGSELSWFQRPLWRGVFIASLWLAFGLAIALVSEWTTLQHSLNELMTTQDPQTLLQKLTEAQQAHGFDVLSFALGIVQKILQPLVGIAFVLLYFGSRKER